jgi:hypothetical protein
MGIRRNLVGRLAAILAGVGVVALFHWTDYYVKGMSPIWEINPRCIEHIGGYCRKLDTSNMPRQATLALWLERAIWYLMIAFMAGGATVILCGVVVGVILLAKTTVTPRGAEPDRLSQLANSR